MSVRIQNPSSRKLSLKPRNLYLDILKGIAVFLVVLGHCLPFDDATYGVNPLHKLIYSFHMPLFAIISGYFFTSSLRNYKHLGSFTAEKFPMLFFPWFTFTSVSWIVKVSQEGIKVFDLKEIFIHFAYSYWFIPAIMLIMLLSWFWGRYLGKRWGVIIVLIIILHLIPNVSFLYEVIKIKEVAYLSLFFVAGIWIKDNQDRLLSLHQKYGKIIFATSLILFGILIMQYDREDYMFTSGVSLTSSYLGFWEQLRIDICRIIIGFSGIICTGYLIYFLQFIKGISIFAKLGEVSLGVYLLHDFLLRYVVSKYSFGGFFSSVYFDAILLSVILSLICYIVLQSKQWIPKLSPYIFGR